MKLLAELLTLSPWYPLKRGRDETKDILDPPWVQSSYLHV